MVEAGDALSLIAWRNGVSLRALLDENDLSITSLILPGQRLDHPFDHSFDPVAAGHEQCGTGFGRHHANGVDYTVRAGDALSLIAWRNGVSLGALLAANDISATSRDPAGPAVAGPVGDPPDRGAVRERLEPPDPELPAARWTPCSRI